MKQMHAILNFTSNFGGRNGSRSNVKFVLLAERKKRNDKVEVGERKRKLKCGNELEQKLNQLLEQYLPTCPTERERERKKKTTPTEETGESIQINHSTYDLSMVR